MGALLGLDLDGVLALPHRELARWQMYWNEEPWGSYRDNLHAAMIVSELLRPHLAEGKTIPMSAFMLEHPEDRKDRERLALAARMGALERSRKKKPKP